MRYDAVIFDLFGTLVDDLIFPESRRPKTWAVMRDIAGALGIEFEDLRDQWQRTSIERNIGAFPTAEATFAHICDALGASASDGQIAEAVRLRTEQMRLALIPRPDTVPTLSALRRDGHKLGLLSNCTVEVPPLWPETPMAPFFDTAVLSCEVGMRKPDPAIYALTCERLRVDPDRCLFVGDGGSQERTGATEAGMDAVLIRAPYDDTADEYREEWPGTRISSLTHVLALVA